MLDAMRRDSPASGFGKESYEREGPEETKEDTGTEESRQGGEESKETIAIELCGCLDSPASGFGEVAMGKKRYVVCQSCGKSVVYAECSERCAPPEDARCKVLTGWLSVSCWKVMGAVDYYDFCSLVCLQRWVDNKVPRIPESFLKAFKDE
jgi:hypothetical protein